MKKDDKEDKYGQSEEGIYRCFNNGINQYYKFDQGLESDDAENNCLMELGGCPKSDLVEVFWYEALGMVLTSAVLGPLSDSLMWCWHHLARRRVGQGR